MDKQFEQMRKNIEDEYNQCHGYSGMDPTKQLIKILEHPIHNTPRCVEELIKKDADVNAHNDKGEYLPILAIKNDDIDTLRLLIKAGAKSGLEDALIEAVYKNNSVITKDLIDAKAYVNYYYKSFFYHGTVLDISVKNNNAEITHHLIAAGADTSKYFDHTLLGEFKHNPIKFALDNALKIENAVRAIARMEGQFHLNLSEELDATSDCLAKLELSQSYENLNELCGINGKMIDCNINQLD
jgi:hypothetical protein